MIAYQIQLRYVIREKIQSETKNSVRNKIQSKTKSEKNVFLLEKNFVRKTIVRKKLSQTLSQISSVQSELSRTN